LTDEQIEGAAIAMRQAYNEHADPGTTVVPWEKAKPDRREAWLVCARAVQAFLKEDEQP